MDWTSDDVFDQIDMIAKVSGKSKEDLLVMETIPYLRAAYNPFVRYYTKRNEADCVSKKHAGHEEFQQSTWAILDLLSKRALSGTAADTAVDMTIAQLTPGSARLFIRILNKDLRMGVGAKTINKVYPGLIPIHKIMLAYKVDWSRVRYPCWASVKKDGVRAVFRNGEFYSRRGLPFKGLEVLKEELADINEPLDGELTVPGETFQTASGKIRSDNPTPNAFYSVFELPELTVPFDQRILQMENLRNFSDHVSNIRQHFIKSKSQAMEFYKAARAIGYEGLILRPYDYKYVGSRSYSWMKVKPLMKDLELKVIEVYEGTGKYVGKLGGVTTEYFGTKGRKEVDVGSGFTDDQRDLYYSDPGLILEHFIQAEAMEETDDGSLRHPIFKEVKE